jgi:2-polyprenyl-6-methoxyphenol hydroxylase-like FAD-dependent oxidoreductase
MYLARLLEDYLERRGQVVFGRVTPEEIEKLSTQHDLVVIATGRGGLGNFFPVLEEWSPITQPARVLATGLYRGVAPGDPTHDMNCIVHLAPGHGELFDLPMTSFEGRGQILFFEAIPSSPMAAVAKMSYDADPAAFNRMVLDTLRDYFPSVYERVNPAEFGLTRPLDLLQGSVLPRVRRGYAQLPNGRWIVAVGDAHIVNDPVAGQGANAASYAAFALGNTILEDYAFDERFCRKVERRIWDYAEDVVSFANAVLFPPPDHLLGLLGAAAQNQAVADVFVNNYNQPRRAWDILSSPQRTAALLSRYQAAPVA